jgi:hypothetical protein
MMGSCSRALDCFRDLKAVLIFRFCRTGNKIKINLRNSVSSVTELTSGLSYLYCGLARLVGCQLVFL